MAFHEVPIESLEFNPFKKISKQWMLITAGDEKKSNTMTASWGGLGIMWGKNVATAYIRPNRYTKEFVDQTDRFTLSFLPEEERKALNYCGTVSGRDVEDKWAAAGLHPAAALWLHAVSQDSLRHNALHPVRADDDLRRDRAARRGGAWARVDVGSGGRRCGRAQPDIHYHPLPQSHRHERKPDRVRRRD